MKQKILIHYRNTFFYFSKNKTLAVLLAILVVCAIGSGTFLYYNLQNDNSTDTGLGLPNTFQAEEDPVQNPDEPAPDGSNSALPTKSGSLKTPTPSPSNSSSQTSTTQTATPTPAPTPESPSAFVAFYGDSQSDTDGEDLNHARVVDYILQTNANPVFHAGDLMEDGTQDSLDRFNTVTTSLRANRTFYSVLGNNDRKIGDSTTPSPLYLENFTYPNNEQWYSVNFGNLHMVILDSAFSWNSLEQRSWLLADLQSSASQSRITGVIFHHPDFSAVISQHLLDYGVDFVIAGHLHAYSHTLSNGIHYFVTSGQPSIGYFLATIYSSKVNLKVYNSSNALIESFEFNQR